MKTSMNGQDGWGKKSDEERAALLAKKVEVEEMERELGGPLPLVLGKWFLVRMKKELDGSMDLPVRERLKMMGDLEKFALELQRLEVNEQRFRKQEQDLRVKEERLRLERARVDRMDRKLGVVRFGRN